MDGNYHNSLWPTIFFISIISVLSVSFTTFVDFSFVSGEEVIDTITVGDIPIGIAYNPDNGNVYVTNLGPDSVSVIDSSTNTVIDTIEVNDNPLGIAYNPDNGNMYLTNPELDSVSVIDSSSHLVVDTIAVEDGPREVAYNSDNGNMYVTNYDSDSVSVIDSSTNNVIDIIAVEPGPYGVAHNPDSSNMFVTNTNLDSVSVIDSSTNSVIDIITVGDRPFGLAHNPEGNNMYVTTFDSDSGSDSDSVSVIDSSTNNVINTVTIGDLPREIAYDSKDGYVYTANFDSDSVSVIDSSTNTVIDTITVGEGPIGVVYHSKSGNVYITNQYSDTVSVIGNPSPIADAGPDQTVQSNDLVQLDGSNSSDPNNSPLSYSWTQTSGPAIELSSPSSQSPTFTAPETEELQSLVFQLTVTNDEGIESEPDAVTIIVNPAVSPIADAGQDQSVESDDLVQLNGTGSSANGGSPIVAYQWSQIEGPSVTLDDPNSATPTFTAPDTEEQVNLGFQLVVTNEQGVESEPDTVTITVKPVLPPIADAGPDQSVESEEIVELDGSNSSDPNGSTLTYSWMQTEGPEVVLSDSTSSNPTFEAPKTNEEINVVFQLTVTNEEGITSEPDEVIITVKPVTMPPQEEKPETLIDIIKKIIQNPSNITNSVESSKQIKELLTDGNQNNDKIVCNLLDERADSILEILKC